MAMPTMLAWYTGTAHRSRLCRLRDKQALAGSAGRTSTPVCCHSHGYSLCVFEFCLVGLMGSVVQHAVAFVVESGGCVGIRGVGKNESNTQKHHDRQKLHNSFLAGEGRTT